MKTNNRFKTKILILVLAFLPFLFNACSSDDNNNSAPINFESITLDLTQVDIDIEDTSFTLNGFAFEAFRAQGTEQSGAVPGILLAFSQGDNPSSIEVDVTNTTGISRITSRIFNNCSQSTRITLFNDGEIIDDFPAFVPTTTEEGGFNDNAYDLDGQSITAIRISSCEAIVESITLE